MTYYIEKAIEDSDTGAMVCCHSVSGYTVDCFNKNTIVTIVSHISNITLTNGKQPIGFPKEIIIHNIPTGLIDSQKWILEQLTVNNVKNGITDDVEIGCMNDIDPYMFSGGIIKEFND